MYSSTQILMTGDTIIGPDRSSISLNQMPGNKETQTLSAFFTLALPEAIKYLRFHLIGNTRAVIGNRDKDFVTLLTNRNGNLWFFVTEFYTVPDQVSKYLAKEIICKHDSLC